MKIETPHPLELEHEELHAILAGATEIPGAIGEAAMGVAEVLHPHFVKEEEYALPPLGLLSVLAQGRITPEMKEVLAMTDRLKTGLSEMLEEHKAIIAALGVLTDAAKKEKKSEYVEFAEKLILHARTEEEVLYPASLLVGEYLRIRLGQ